MNDFDEKIKFRTWDEYDLTADAAIDKYALDLDAESHSHIMNKWLELLAQAQAELSKSKEVMAHVEAKLFIKAKTESIPELGSKPTDSTTKAWIRLQPELKKALRRKRKAENNVQHLQNAKTVLEHRKHMIKVESDLWICGYFSKPYVSKAAKEELESNRKEQHASKLKDSLEKRHKRHNEENKNG